MCHGISPMRCAALVLLLLCPTIVHAQALADRLPANAMIYIGWTGVDKPAPGFDGSHLQAVFSGQGGSRRGALLFRPLSERDALTKRVIAYSPASCHVRPAVCRPPDHRSREPT